MKSWALPDIAVVENQATTHVGRSAGLGRRERGESVQRDRGVPAGEHSDDIRLGISV